MVVFVLVFGSPVPFDHCFLGSSALVPMPAFQRPQRFEATVAFLSMNGVAPESDLRQQVPEGASLPPMAPELSPPLTGNERHRVWCVCSSHAGGFAHFLLGRQNDGRLCLWHLAFPTAPPRSCVTPVERELSFFPSCMCFLGGGEGAGLSGRSPTLVRVWSFWASALATVSCPGRWRRHWVTSCVLLACWRCSLKVHSSKWNMNTQSVLLKIAKFHFEFLSI